MAKIKRIQYYYWHGTRILTNYVRTVFHIIYIYNFVEIQINNELIEIKIFKQRKIKLKEHAHVALELYYIYMIYLCV